MQSVMLFHADLTFWQASITIQSWLSVAKTSILSYHGYPYLWKKTRARGVFSDRNRRKLKQNPRIIRKYLPARKGLFNGPIATFTAISSKSRVVGVLIQSAIAGILSQADYMFTIWLQLFIFGSYVVFLYLSVLSVYICRCNLSYLHLYLKIRWFKKMVSALAYKAEHRKVETSLSSAAIWLKKNCNQKVKTGKICCSHKYCGIDSVLENISKKWKMKNQ